MIFAVTSVVVRRSSHLTLNDHDELLGFLRAARLDWAGFFPFSPEDGTAAVDLDGEVEVALAAERLRECGDVQEPITQAARDALVGSTITVMVDAVDGDGLVARSHREAPEIDGVIRVPGADARPGALITVEVTNAIGPDLVGTPQLAGVSRP